MRNVLYCDFTVCRAFVRRKIYIISYVVHLTYKSRDMYVYIHCFGLTKCMGSYQNTYLQTLNYYWLTIAYNYVMTKA